MAYKVTIDAGHGGFDNGATYENRKEKDEALRLALLVGQILSDNGIDVNYTRTIDVYQRPARKAEIANETGSDLFVSIHRNSADYPNHYNGVETLVYNKGDMKEVLANNINDELGTVGYNVIGVEERPNLIVLNQTQMPSILVEAGFINSDMDNQLYDEKFYETGSAIARGIIKTIMKE
ncbi:MAG: N-acetylmuramoyl-L-alanine amidase [Velocimicrobium sp.]